MSSTQPFRIALAIAAMFVCSGIAHAQDVNSSWLLRAPQIASRYGLDPSAARIDLKPSQSPQTPNPNGSPSREQVWSVSFRRSHQSQAVSVAANTQSEWLPERIRYPLNAGS